MKKDHNIIPNFDFASLYPTSIVAEDDEIYKSLWEERLRLKRVKERRIKLEKILSNL